MLIDRVMVDNLRIKLSGVRPQLTEGPQSKINDKEAGEYNMIATNIEVKYEDV